ncbi:hypothetical protein GWK08_18120 [Leptobacterium flavescens]|uniref:Signal transduction histidine kinase internal region domain-containing protein n=1 Tax=Leptobacterium flavescens TaxID=472055 RepID=A0A6P0UR60_9FLAO|nr:histidine kinase [Leptobacterium flavescens]NER15377.1 hypothetical protein [Leptobacterium flavescens]
MDRSYKRLIKYEPLLHILFWSAALFYPYLKFIGIEGGYDSTIWHALVDIVFYAIPVYILYFWFFPLKNKGRFILPVVLMFIINTFLYMYFDSFFHEENPYPINIVLVRTTVIKILGYLSFSLAFFALYSIKELFRKQKEIDEIANKEQQAQLRLLKGQINPHFLFNTLNTIYASALDKEEKTPDLILKLSDSFRYVLHEGQKNKVALKKEVRHLKDYINLQKERLSDKVEVDWKEDIDNYEQQIPPLLLISFVENAFKYSSVLTGAGHRIIIKIVLKEKDFRFYCENSFKENYHDEMEINWKESGIGLQNTRKRLQLLFPGKHELKINSEDYKFKVDLSIQL